VSSTGHTRTKRGGVSATITPQTKDAGRRRTAAAEIVEMDEEDDALSALVVALVERAARAYGERVGADPEVRSHHAIRAALHRSRKDLRKAGRHEDLAAVEAAFSVFGAQLGQDLAHATAGMRAYVQEVARRFVADFVALRIATTEEAALALQKARCRAASAAIWRSVLSVGIAHPGMSRSFKDEKGATVRVTSAGGAEMVARMAALDDAALRYGLTLEAKCEARRSRGPGQKANREIQERLERLLAARSAPTVVEVVAPKEEPEPVLVEVRAEPEPEPVPSIAPPVAPPPPDPDLEELARVRAGYADPDGMDRVAYCNAALAVVGRWLGIDQQQLNKHRLVHKSHPLPRPRRIPLPVSKWFAGQDQTRAKWVVRELGWTLEGVDS